MDFMSRFPRKECKMPEVEWNLPFPHQVRRITQGTKGGLRINQILVNMARDGRKDEKYVKCVEAILKGRSPKEVKKEDPDHPFVELTVELVSKRKGDSMGLWKNLCLEDPS